MVSSLNWPRVVQVAQCTKSQLEHNTLKLCILARSLQYRAHVQLAGRTNISLSYQLTVVNGELLLLANVQLIKYLSEYLNYFGKTPFLSII